MLAKCVVCKKPFMQIFNERKCSPHKKIQHFKPSLHAEFWAYLSSTRRYYQNPIWQFWKEFISTEESPHNHTSYFELIESEWY